MRLRLVLPRAAVCAAALVAAAAAVPAAAGAAGACETVRHAHARHDAHRLRRAPLIVGDSTLLLAAPYLGRLGIEADARGCRQLDAGIDLLVHRRHARTLPAVVVLALGSNGAITTHAIERALRVLGRSRVLGLVTPSRPGSGSAAAMRRARRRHPGRVLLVDWHAYSVGRGGVFAGDGLHVSDHGARVFAAFVRRRLEPFLGPRRALRVPATDAGARSCGPALHVRGRAVDVLVVRGGDRVLCARARALARADGLRGVAGWRWYDYRRSGRRPWSDVFVRSDRRVIVVTRPAQPVTAPESPPAPAA